ncbi:zinc-binding metallopeptidase [Parachryseolinea silvisoli]|uniref:zinc-binding metallopeptidase n=1 Tax=Parachryseolinea silvisoli TaxID=2873601 RepID=UPI002265F8CA|nr:putative zinc-binding metallopeptidase [Parachryseolinea silvisoli]MCD9015522.1 putative zinc-binding metallopeptidase [Parachryseolinea silvisoli]
MNKKITITRYGFSLIVFSLLLAACGSDDDLSAGSNLDTTPGEFNALDTWIDDNFITPYNIEVIYRWSESLVEQDRYLYPPLADSVQPALNVVRKLWIEPYTAVAGAGFVERIAPRQIVLVGGRNVNPSGTITLGLAEAGKRITLFEIDLLDKTDRAAVVEFIHTIQHEYVHILNQIKPFDEAAYGTISPEGYTAQWFNETTAGSRTEGFITAYARASEIEDFAEMASTMLNMSRAEWDALVDGIGNTGTTRIRQKERIVVDYYKSAYDIDLYVLQDSVDQATRRLIGE